MVPRYRCNILREEIYYYVHEQQPYFNTNDFIQVIRIECANHAREVADKSHSNYIQRYVRVRSKAHAVIAFAIINCEYHLIAILLKVISLLN